MTLLAAALAGYLLAGWLSGDPSASDFALDALLNPAAGVAGGGILATLASVLGVSRKVHRIERSPSRADARVTELEATVARLQAEVGELRGMLAQLGIEALVRGARS